MSTCPMATLGLQEIPQIPTHGVGVTIGHQLMSTCPMATLGPPRDPTDTNTWSGGDNQPSTDVYLSNGHIRPSKKSKIILETKEESERKGRVIPRPMSQSTLIKKGWAQGCGSADISRRHVCLPHDAVWCHPSHHHIVKARSTCASHPDIPEEPITLACLPTRGTILAFPWILATGMIPSDLVCM